MGFGSAGSSMINTQGVQMPADESFNGFGSNSNTRGWQWGSVVAQHTSDGTLTLRFNFAGGNNWKCVDDVHLYYSETADGFYQITTDNNDVPASKVLTCDIVLTNPNTIVSSDEAIITASGNQLNNNLVSGNVANLVLFDGNEFTATGDARYPGHTIPQHQHRFARSLPRLLHHSRRRSTLAQHKLRRRNNGHQCCTRCQQQSKSQQCIRPAGTPSHKRRLTKGYLHRWRQKGGSQIK